MLDEKADGSETELKSQLKSPPELAELGGVDQSRGRARTEVRPATVAYYSQRRNLRPHRPLRRQR